MNFIMCILHLVCFFAFWPGLIFTIPIHLLLLKK